LGIEAVKTGALGEDGGGLTRQTVYRIKNDPAGSEAALMAGAL